MASSDPLGGSPGESLPGTFATIARLHAERPAMVCGERVMSYDQLNRRANTLARAIVSMSGTGAGRIAILCAADMWLPVAILAVLKAGKTYVPLDARFPEARTRAMIVDCEASAILTDAVNATSSTAFSSDVRRIIDVESVSEPIDDRALGSSIPGDTPAYILYTSGSTGHPKGVIQTHRNVLHYVTEYSRMLLLSSTDRLSLTASPTYGAAMIDTFAALLNGASLHPYDMPGRGAASLAPWLREQRITVFHSVPTVFRRLAARTESVAAFSSVRVVCLGGEPAMHTDVEIFRRNFRGASMLANPYGGTEFGIASLQLVLPGTAVPRGNLAMGRPLTDTTIAIVDETGKELPAGHDGQITICSRYLSPGYWRRPELTESSFSTAPDGRRVYRTGDVGRILADGRLQHLGRADFQVKIRGQRVEVAEVEGALLELDAVREAAVLARPDLDGEQRLIGYIVPHAGARPSSQQLRASVADRLPMFMIPTTFVTVDALPRTDNGKLDRAALATLSPQAATVEQHDGARDVLEVQLAQMWQRLLHIAEPGITDDFFTIGGDSLSAVDMLAEVSKRYGREFTLSDLLPQATIAHLSDLIRRPVSSDSPALVALQSAGDRSPFYAIHAIDGDVFGYGPLSRHLGATRPVYGIRACGIDGSAAPLTSVKTIAAYCIGQMRALQPEGPYLLGGYSFGGLVAFEMAQQLRADQQDVTLLVVIDQGPTRGDSAALSSPLIIIRLLRYVARLTSYVIAEALTAAGRARLAAQYASGTRLVRRQGQAIRRSPAADLVVELPRVAPHFRWVWRAVEDLWEQIPMPSGDIWLSNLRASRAYRVRPYPGNMVVVAARRPSLALSVLFGDPSAGWRRFVSGQLQIRQVFGGHAELLREPYVQAVARELRDCFDRIGTDQAGGRDRPSAKGAPRSTRT